MRILLVKTSSMGDVVHALPAVSDMARAIPGIQIDWLVEKSFAAIPSQHSAVQRVITLQWRKWRKSLRQENTRVAIKGWRKEMALIRYDLIIDMQGLIKSAAFACCADGPRGGYDWRSSREPLASLTYQRKVHVARDIHAVDRCRQLAARLLGYALPDTPADFGLQISSENWLPEGGAFAILIPCASRPEKLWPLENWIAIGQGLRQQGLQVVVLWGNPEEQRLAQAIATRVGGQTPPFLTVAQVSDTLARATLAIGLDTGMSHIAAAHGRPTVGIYCDHEPGLAGLRGSGPVISLGGKGQTPSLADVQAALQQVLSDTQSPVRQ